HQTYQPAPTFITRPDIERLVDVKRNTISIQPDTPAGRDQYNIQANQYLAEHGTKKPNEYRPYPPTPGSQPLASGCQRPPAPRREFTWRQVAGGIENRVRRGGQAAAMSVNLVSHILEYEEELERRNPVTREDYDLVIVTNFDLYFGRV
ncbi:hypothetical protein FA13DRAFT_1799723, partial [Coprinellus micaceus]